MDGLYERDVLAVSLREARARTLAAYGHLDLASLTVPCIETINPPLWEWAHIAYFQEFWCLRDGKRGPAESLAPSRLPGADAMFDSARVAHGSRWHLPYPPLETLRRYMETTLEDTLSRLPTLEEMDLYFPHLCLFHEDMHVEALWITLQQLGLPAPAPEAPAPEEPEGFDIALGPARFEMGTPASNAGFVFDNEMGAHPVSVDAYAISSTVVTQEQFLAFVEDGGYRRREWWTPEGWAWRESAAREAPRFWRRIDGAWQARRFDRWEALRPRAPMVHVALHEAQAWCAWAGRRLPSEAEWEHAARVAPSRGWRAGGVWQWTATPFRPYPGFVAGPYREYSQPWFETHFVLRGGSFVTQPRIATPRYRNFYRAHRDDVFAGFRTCALRA
jgi:gamma-glutamyl hercynylcysteine S-oxide synthase